MSRHERGASLRLVPSPDERARDGARRSPATPAPAPARSRSGSALPADLARAIAALRSAEEALARPDPERAGSPAPPRCEAERDAECFTAVGRPRWRAGPRQAGPGRAPCRTGRVEAATTPGDGRGDPLARRIISIDLPDFAIARFLRHLDRMGEAPPDDIPVVLAREGTHGPVVHDANRAAWQAGIQPGQRIVDTRALCPEARVEFADPAGDAAALERLMLWARRWCPWTAVDGARGLVLDATGSAHLWGGEAEMLREIEGSLGALGFAARLAMAPTHGAAWGLARHGGAVRPVVRADGLAQALGPLPVAGLRIDADTALLLQRLGLKRVGDLAAVPRPSLARRFVRAAPMQNPLVRLDQMMGRLAEPVSAPEEPPRFAVQTRLPEPVQDPEPHLPALCAALCEGLARAGHGARRLVLTVYRTDGEVAQVSLATARASRDPAHLRRMFDGRLERIDPGFGFDLIVLAATQAEDMAVVQTRLDGGVDAGAALARLVDRLTARLGTRAVQSPLAVESHVPERAERHPSALAQAPTPAVPRTLRPARLFDGPEEVRVLYAVPEGPPAQFVWRRVTHRVTRFSGPERIAPEWWRDGPGTRLRDYYVIEDEAGRRIWLYREGVLGDGRGATPRWFVHGMFG